jgi:alkylhydroperoxidase family enzyme
MKNEIARKLAQREPLVPLVEVEDFQGPMREAADRTLKRSGRVPNQARAMANAGDLGAAYRRFFEDISVHAKLPPEFRFLIRYKVSTLNACLYCSAHQVWYMTKAGMSEEKINNIHDSDTHPAFNERERVGLAFAAAMIEDASNIDEDLAGRFVTTFTPEERAEIAIIAGTMACMNKVNDALRIPLEETAIDLVGTGINPMRFAAE